MARILLNVRPTGSDSSGDGSLSKPWRSVPFAAAQVPKLASPLSRYVLNIDGINDVLSDPLIIDAHMNAQAPALAGLQGVPAPFPSESYLTIEATPQVLLTLPTSGVTATVDPKCKQLTIHVPGASWTPNQWKDKVLVGPGNFDEAPIQSNDADSLRVACSGLSNLNALLIVDYGATLTGQSLLGGTVQVRGSSSVVTFNGIKLAHQNQYGNALVVGPGAGVALNLCDVYAPNIVGATVLSAFGSHIHSFDNAGPQVDSWLKADGVDLNNCRLSSLSPDAAWREGGLTSCIVDTCRWLDTGGIGTAPYVAAMTQFINCGAIVQGGSSAEFSDCRFDNATVLAHVNPRGSGIYVCGGAVLFAEGDIGGSGNAGLGIEVECGGRLWTEETEPVTLDIHGALGDVQVGPNAPRSCASLTAMPLEFAVDGSYFGQNGHTTDALLESTVAYSATPVLDATVARTIHLAVEGDVTGATIVGVGAAGRRLQIALVKGNTTDQWTVQLTGSNVRAPEILMPAAPNSIVMLELAWMGSLPTPAWVLASDPYLVGV